MKRVFFCIHTPLWQLAKTRCVFETYAIICIFGNTQTFQNKDIQLPKYSVVLHLDHCMPVPGGGGGCLLFLSPVCHGDHRTPLYTTRKGTPNIPFIEAHRKLSPKHVPVFPI